MLRLKTARELPAALCERLRLPEELFPGGGRLTLSGGRQALIAWSQPGADERSKSPESRICGTTNSNMSTLSREKCAIGGLSGFVSTVV